MRIDGIFVRRFVHRLVAEAFLGLPPPGMVVNHKDGNKQNNNLNNLEYLTQRDNIAHARALGRHGKALTWEKAEEIRSLRGTAAQREIAKRYGVTHQAVSLVLTGKTWA